MSLRSASRALNSVHFKASFLFSFSSVSGRGRPRPRPRLRFSGREAHYVCMPFQPLASEFRPCHGMIYRVPSQICPTPCSCSGFLLSLSAHILNNRSIAHFAEGSLSQYLLDKTTTQLLRESIFPKGWHTHLKVPHTMHIGYMVLEATSKSRYLLFGKYLSRDEKRIPFLRCTANLYFKTADESVPHPVNCRRATFAARRTTRS